MTSTLLLGGSYCKILIVVVVDAVRFAGQGLMCWSFGLGVGRRQAWGLMLSIGVVGTPGESCRIPPWTVGGRFVLRAT